MKKKAELVRVTPRMTNARKATLRAQVSCPSCGIGSCMSRRPRRGRTIIKRDRDIG